MVNPRLQTPQGESVAKSETLLLITLGLVREYDIKEVHVNKSNLFSTRKIYGQKHPKNADKCFPHQFTTIS